MAKLKTYPEIVIDWNDDAENVRNEAIKWYHQSDGNKHRFIKHFFNLTEEEIREASKRD